jgi:hypothetical protein
MPIPSYPAPSRTFTDPPYGITQQELVNLNQTINERAEQIYKTILPEPSFNPEPPAPRSALERVFSDEDLFEETKKERMARCFESLKYHLELGLGHSWGTGTLELQPIKSKGPVQTYVYRRSDPL